MRAVLKAQINKTDRNDARGIAPLPCNDKICGSTVGSVVS
jgi:hypothetical protein